MLLGLCILYDASALLVGQSAWRSSLALMTVIVAAALVVKARCKLSGGTVEGGTN